MNKKLHRLISSFHLSKPLFFLIFIFLVALFLRLIYLENLPATFFVDEVLSGYLGRYLWTNGIDLYGNYWPLLYFNKFGDYYIILPMYLDGLATLVFGLTRFATRLPTAFLGSLAIFPIYAIGQRLSKQHTPALLAAILLAILPWHIVLSRATTESIIELTFIATASWALIESEGKHRLRWLSLAAIISLLSYLIYHTARIIVPLLWLGHLLIFWPKLKQKPKLLLTHLIIVCVFFILTLIIGQTEWGKGRFDQTSIFSEQSGVSIRQTEMTYNLGQDQVLLARIFHNKIISYGREFANQYMTYFSPQFLFADLGWKNTRYAVPEAGLLYFSLLIMLLVNLLPKKATPQSLIKNTNDKLNRRLLLFLLWWLLVSPIPSALTVIESPNIRRTVLMTLPIVILAGRGWWQAFSIRWKKLNFGQLITALLIAEFILFFYLYLKQSDLSNSLFRSDSLPEVAQYIQKNIDQADHFLVFNSYDFPLYYLFASSNLSPTLATQFQFGLKINSIDKVELSKHQCINELSQLELIQVKPKSLLLQPHICDTPDDTKGLVQIDRIHGINPAIFYDVFRKEF